MLPLQSVSYESWKGLGYEVVKEITCGIWSVEYQVIIIIFDCLHKLIAEYNFIELYMITPLFLIATKQLA